MRPLRYKLGVALLPLVFVAASTVPGRESRDPGDGSVTHRASLRPVVIGRSTWHADEKSVHGKPQYDRSVKAIFIHHTDNPNDYDCKTDVPAMLLAIEETHIHDMGWDDLGYNFIVDRCGNIYEGRAGGVDRDVRGAHTEGFNVDTVGVAALGNFGKGQKVPRPMLEAIASIAAWKLDPGIDPRGRVRLVSSNDESRFPKGKAVMLHAISGHRDAYETTCPGDALYAKLPWIRDAAARLRAKAIWTT
ncbi:N-acetylmuramoyl-L-alanine amidase [Streptomyces sp. NBC_01476]|uniref:N-acetylmuramoyl-L-alanine amidase n=1 Tax=Streptomyces sp. NBC_01476 TaxID=2903881 RepID=UPI002E317098|nr:N-acetylmuramoyl-L-alanine amidase [Streptomyces sp. NBC_01476]